MRHLLANVCYALVVLPQIFSFTPKSIGRIAPPTIALPSLLRISSTSHSGFEWEDPLSSTTPLHSANNHNINNLLVATTVGIVTAFSVIPSALAVAAEEVYEVAELPPVYVPVIFGIVLLIGVGLLTGSLGDVIDEESQLGMQSGARARKEMERSRSSYFKKK